MLVRRALLCAVTSSLLLCSVAAGAARAPRIVGGSASGASYAALLQIQGTGLCSGSLVGTRTVITAGHCVFDDFNQRLAPSDIQLWVGITNAAQATPQTAITPTSISTLASYDLDTNVGDIAVLQIPPRPTASPLGIAAGGDPAVGTVPFALGFGLTATGGSPSPQLLGVAQPVVDPSRCASAYGGAYTAESMICAGGVVGQDSCNGDSGGPLVRDPAGAAPIQVGLVSYGSVTCADGTPAVYSRLGSGTVGSFLRTTGAPIATIAVPDPLPVIGSTETVTASATHVGASPSFAWDLDGAGTYAAGSGTSLSVPITAATRSIGVRAVGTDTAITQVPITPIDPGVTVGAPATAVEGGTVPVTVTRTGNGFGPLTASIGGGAAQTVTVPAQPTLTLTVPNPDSRWSPPRQEAIAVTGSAKVALRGSAPVVTVTDDDRPVLTVTSRRVVRRGYDERVTVPGAGTVVATLRRGSTTVLRRTTTTTGPGVVTLRLRLSARQATAYGRRRPVLGVTWTSSQQATATASASRTLARVKR